MVLRHSPRQKERGFTLTELAIVLGVIGAILGGIWSATAHVHDAQKVQKGAAQIVQILTNYRSLYAQHGVDTYDGISTADMVDVTCNGVNANFFPADMANPAACVTTTLSTKPFAPWPNASVSVWGQQSTQMIMIGYSGLPHSACENLMLAATTSPDAIYQFIANAGGTNVQNITTATPVWSPTQVDSYCDANADNNIIIGYKGR